MVLIKLLGLACKRRTIEGSLYPKEPTTCIHFGNEYVFIVKTVD